MILENVSDEFLERLDACPAQWFLDEQTEDSVNYVFMKEIEED